MCAKKDGEFVNVKLGRSLAGRFNRYVEEIWFPKAVVIGNALKEYMDRYVPPDGVKFE